jgi:hypothetical protein
VREKESTQASSGRSRGTEAAVLNSVERCPRVALEEPIAWSLQHRVVQFCTLCRVWSSCLLSVSFCEGEDSVPVCLALPLRLVTVALALKSAPSGHSQPATSLLNMGHILMVLRNRGDGPHATSHRGLLWPRQPGLGDSISPSAPQWLLAGAGVTLLSLMGVGLMGVCNDPQDCAHPL